MGGRGVNQKCAGLVKKKNNNKNKNNNINKKQQCDKKEEKHASLCSRIMRKSDLLEQIYPS